MAIHCVRCEDTFWVCESHQHKPWDGDSACDCRDAGVPCPDCNASTRQDDPPRNPKGFKTKCTCDPAEQ